MRVQNPILLGAHSEPVPDLALVRHRQDFYKSAHPRAEDVLLIIEVAEASLCYDSEIKVPLYALSAVPEVWILDLDGQRLTRYLSPKGHEYRRTDTPQLAAPVSVSAIPDLRVELSSVF